MAVWLRRFSLFRTSSFTSAYFAHFATRNKSSDGFDNEFVEWISVEEGGDSLIPLPNDSDGEDGVEPVEKTVKDLVVAVDGKKRKLDLVRPRPGTVTEYNAHVLLRFPGTQGGISDVTLPNYCPWPPVVEKEPLFLHAFNALSNLGLTRENGTHVKLSAYENIGEAPNLRKDECGLIIFPIGIEYPRLKVNLLQIAFQLAMGDISDLSNSDRHHLRNRLPRPLECDSLMSLLVCCHGSRDKRCGIVGSSVAHKLEGIVREKKIQKHVRVLKCSHLGGDKYAGNVVCYCNVAPNNGDWFGGINEFNAPKLFDTITLHVKRGNEDGLHAPFLRDHWRGRASLYKDQQLEVMEQRMLRDFILAKEEEKEEELAMQKAEEQFEAIFEGAFSADVEIAKDDPLAHIKVFERTEEEVQQKKFIKPAI